jgi:uncharacterized protein with ParB-like and HNH nuclease domain
MKASETILQPILEGTKQYVVPLFQRTYSWKSDNWKTLWDDLIALYGESSNANKKKHFLGAIVSMPVEMTPAGVNKFLLIDGQQRITTLFLILAAIRDVGAKENSNLADQINELYLTNKWATGSNILKLFPSQTDREQFSRILQQKGSLDESSNVVKAYRYFCSKLSGKDSIGQKIDLQQMHTTLIQEIMVVKIVLDKDENPYLIFESLNAKGEPLTQADLVRNYMLMRITDADEQEVAYRDFWLPMQDTLGNELTAFIWRYLIKDGSSVKAIRLDEIYDEVKQKLKGANSSQVVDLLMDMHTFSGYYQCLINPNMESNEKLRRRLKIINRWDVKTTYPFLLNLYRDFREHRISFDDFYAILETIESFVVRRSFCRIPTNALNKIFLGLYKTTDLKNPLNSITSELKTKEWPNDAAFQDAWINFPIYLSGTTKCRHILESLEEALITNNEPVDLSNRQITIEHIMPQTLNEDWEELLGEKAADVYDAYLHTIGNLTLTGSNSDMGNKSLLEKRKVFAQSNFALNKDIAQAIVWGELIIYQRAKKLFNLAQAIWLHPGGNDYALSDDTINQSKDPTGKKPTGFALFGTEYRVDSWREMLLSTLSELAARHGDEFVAKAIQVRTSKRSHISLQRDNMTTPIKIPGTELWVEANQSSKGILWLIDLTLKALGDKEEDFEAYW